MSGERLELAWKALRAGELTRVRALMAQVEAVLEARVAPPWDPDRGPLGPRQVQSVEATEGPRAATPVAQDLVHQAAQDGWTAVLPVALRLPALCCINGGDRDRSRPLFAPAGALVREAQDPLWEGGILWTQARAVLPGGDTDQGHELLRPVRGRALRASAGRPRDWETHHDVGTGLLHDMHTDDAGVAAGTDRAGCGPRPGGLPPVPGLSGPWAWPGGPGRAGPPGRRPRGHGARAVPGALD